MGLMDVLGLMSPGNGELGMIDQIKAAGESFAHMNEEIKNLKLICVKILEQNETIIAMLSEKENAT